jgi:hypothetical protein
MFIPMNIKSKNGIRPINQIGKMIDQYLKVKMKEEGERESESDVKCKCRVSYSNKQVIRMALRDHNLRLRADM